MRTVGNAFKIGKHDIGFRVGCKILQIIGDICVGGVAGRNSLAHADSGLDGIVQEGRQQVPALTHNGQATRRGIRRHNLGTHRYRRRDHPLAVRSGQQHAQLLGGCDQFVFQATALLAGLPIAPTGDKGGPHADLGTGTQQFDVGRSRRAHKDEVSLIRRNLLYGPIA